MGTRLHAVAAGVLLLLSYGSCAAGASDPEIGEMQSSAVSTNGAAALAFYAEGMAVAEGAKTEDDYRTAVDLYRRAVSADPSSLEPRSELLKLLVALNDNEAAMSEMISLAELKRNDVDAWAGAFIFAKAHKFAEAFIKCSDVLLKFSDTELMTSRLSGRYQVHAMRMAGFSEMKKTDLFFDAFSDLTGMAEEFGFKPPADGFDDYLAVFRYACGSMASQTNGVELVTRLLDMALEAAVEVKQRSHLCVTAGYSFLMKSRPDEKAAMELITRGMLEDPLNASPLFLLNPRSPGLPKYDKLEETLQQLDKHEHDSRLDYAFALAKASLLGYFMMSERGWAEFEKGEKALEDNFPGKTPPWQHFEVKGMLLYYLGRKDEGFAVLDRALEAAPENVGLKNCIAYLLAEEGRDLDRALDLIDSVVRAEPDESAYLDTLGWVLYKRGDYAGATSSMMKAVANAYDEQHEPYDHIGDIFAATGGSKAGVPWWIKSYQIFPNEKVGAKLRNAGVDPDSVK